MLKRFIVTALLAVGIAAPAIAAINVRQNGDGTADYVGNKGETLACLGGAVVPTTTFRMDALSTGVAVSPITNAVIRSIRAARNGSTTAGTAKLTFWLTPGIGSQAASLLTPVSFYGLSGASTYVLSTAFINMFAGGISRTGVISTLREAGASFLATGDVSNAITVGAGDYLAVQSDGGATGAISGAAFFHLCPR